jgi:chromate transport protein ChrA
MFAIFIGHEARGGKCILLAGALFVASYCFSIFFLYYKIDSYSANYLASLNNKMIEISKHLLLDPDSIAHTSKSACNKFIHLAYWHHYF